MYFLSFKKVRLKRVGCILQCCTQTVGDSRSRNYKLLKNIVSHSEAVAVLCAHKNNFAEIFGANIGKLCKQHTKEPSLNI